MLIQRAKKNNPALTNHVHMQQIGNHERTPATSNDQKMTNSSVRKICCQKLISKPPKTKIRGGKRGFNQALASFDHEVRHFARAISDPEAIISKAHEAE